MGKTAMERGRRREPGRKGDNINRAMGVGGTHGLPCIEGKKN